MEKSSFWLIHIDNSYVTVGLAQNGGQRFLVSAIGTPVPWTSLDPETIVIAADQSLSEAATVASISDEAEPSQAAFILTPAWIGSDGKIAGNYLKLIESICKKLDLRPLGFIANDEAILESANSDEGLPPSLILVYLNQVSFDVSLIYLGKIKERLHRDITSQFSPQALETALTEFQTESTLPPQITIFGHYTDEVAESLKNYAWIGKKNIETFLHFPTINQLSLKESFSIFLSVIQSQFNFGGTKMEVSPTPSPEVSSIDPEPVPEIVETVEDNTEENPVGLEVVDAADLGFTTTEIDEKPAPVTTVPLVIHEMPTPAVIPNQPDFTNEPEYTPTPVKKSLPKVNFRLPRFKFNIGRLLVLILAVSPILIITPFLLAKSKVTIFLSPINFNKTISADLNTYQVKQKSFDVSLTASVSTTGQKTIGDKAVGDVTIFNQSTKSQNLAKGTILQADNGLKFELSSPVQVASSSANYDTGIITMGQTKASVTAADIGTEYNLIKDTKLSVPGGLMAKVTAGLSGGTKKTIAAVSAQDKTNIESQINGQISQMIDSKTNNELKNLNGVLSNTVSVKHNRIEYNREVGEEADQLTADSSNSVSVFYIDNDTKTQIINNVFRQDADFSAAAIDYSQFELTFQPDKNSTDFHQGQLTIHGKSLPKLDVSSLSQKLAGKFKSQAAKIIPGFSSRIYDYKIDSVLNPLPLLATHINIEVK